MQSVSYIIRLHATRATAVVFYIVLPRFRPHLTSLRIAMRHPSVDLGLSLLLLHSLPKNKTKQKTKDRKSVV